MSSVKGSNMVLGTPETSKHCYGSMTLASASSTIFTMVGMPNLVLKSLYYQVWYMHLFRIVMQLLVLCTTADVESGRNGPRL